MLSWYWLARFSSPSFLVSPPTSRTKNTLATPLWRPFFELLLLLLTLASTTFRADPSSSSVTPPLTLGTSTSLRVRTVWITLPWAGVVSQTVVQSPTVWVNPNFYCILIEDFELETLFFYTLLQSLLTCYSQVYHISTAICMYTPGFVLEGFQVFVYRYLNFCCA